MDELQQNVLCYAPDRDLSSGWRLIQSSNNWGLEQKMHLMGLDTPMVRFHIHRHLSRQVLKGAPSPGTIPFKGPFAVLGK